MQRKVEMYHCDLICYSYSASKTHKLRGRVSQGQFDAASGTNAPLSEICKIVMKKNYLDKGAKI